MSCYLALQQTITKINADQDMISIKITKYMLTIKTYSVYEYFTTYEGIIWHVASILSTSHSQDRFMDSLKVHNKA